MASGVNRNDSYEELSMNVERRACKYFGYGIRIYHDTPLTIMKFKLDRLILDQTETFEIINNNRPKKN